MEWGTPPLARAGNLPKACLTGRSLSLLWARGYRAFPLLHGNFVVSTLPLCVGCGEWDRQLTPLNSLVTSTQERHMVLREKNVHD